MSHIDADLKCDFPWDLHIFETLDSTQDSVFSFARSHEKLTTEHQGYAVQALRQVKGRGRHGRVWHDGVDDGDGAGAGNLCVSFLLLPECDLRILGTLSLVIGISLSKVIEGFDLGVKPVLKWPNDVLIAGQKCAGILIETDTMNDHDDARYVVVGIGVNIAHSPIEGGAALNDINDEGDQGRVKLESFRDQLMVQIGHDYLRWCEDGFAAFHDDWMARSHIPGTEVSVKLGNDIVKGSFHDIDEFGNLRINEADGCDIRTITAGEVYFKHATCD